MNCWVDSAAELFRTCSPIIIFVVRVDYHHPSISSLVPNFLSPAAETIRNCYWVYNIDIVGDRGWSMQLYFSRYTPPEYNTILPAAEAACGSATIILIDQALCRAIAGIFYRRTLDEIWNKCAVFKRACIPIPWRGTASGNSRDTQMWLQAQWYLPFKFYDFRDSVIAWHFWLLKAFIGLGHNTWSNHEHNTRSNHEHSTGPNQVHNSTENYWRVNLLTYLLTPGASFQGAGGPSPPRKKKKEKKKEKKKKKKRKKLLHIKCCFFSNFSRVRWHWRITKIFGPQEKVEMTPLTYLLTYTCSLFARRLNTCNIFKCAYLYGARRCATSVGIQVSSYITVLTAHPHDKNEIPSLIWVWNCECMTRLWSPTHFHKT